MGFFDRDVQNGLDTMFDMNKDGVLSPAEQAMKFEFLDRMTREDDEDDDD